MTFVTYEDRPSEFAGIWSAIVFPPGASKELCAWWEMQKRRSVRVITDVARRGWNSKTYCILAALDARLSEVVWLDSDIALAGPLASIFFGDPSLRGLIPR